MPRKSISIVTSLIAGAAALFTTALVPVAAGASTGTLFGLNPSPGAIFAIDPSTGAATTLADLPADPTGEPPTFFGLASDPDHQRLFTVRAFATDATFTTVRWQVVTVDSQTGATSISPALAQDVPNDLAFDPASGDLIGITGNQAPQSVVRIDPISGAITHVADLSLFFTGGFAFAPATRTMFVPGQILQGTQALNVIITIDTQTGAVSTSPAMSVPINQLVYDSESAKLFGAGGFPASIYQIDTGTGAQTLLASTASGISILFSQFFGIDSATHTIFVKDDDFSTGSDVQTVESVSDVTGASTVSSGGLTTGFFINTLTFEGPPTITPASVAAQVRQAFASGAIQGQGLEQAILSQLSAAADARARGQCATSGHVYGAAINLITAQSGTKIEAATANTLVFDIQFLIDHCP